MSNKTIMITGASSGIGEATATRLAGDGHHVVIAARRTDRLTQIADRINVDGGRATALPVDVTDHAAVAALVDSVVSEFGGLDVVVACAGVMLRSGQITPWDTRVKLPSDAFRHQTMSLNRLSRLSTSKRIIDSTTALNSSDITAIRGHHPILDGRTPSYSGDTP